MSSQFPASQMEGPLWIGTPRSDRWLSAHLYFPGKDAATFGRVADATVLDVVLPFVSYCRGRGLIDSYFFIRYREGGAHIRLRLRGDADVLADIVGPALIDHLQAVSPELTIADDSPEAVTMAAPISRMRWVAYEPEVLRYGGALGLPIAERFFEASSDVALTLLPIIRDKGTRVRLGQALLASLAIAHAFEPVSNDALGFFVRYRIGFLAMKPLSGPDGRARRLSEFARGFERQREALVPYVHESWRRLQDGEAVSEGIDRLHDAAQSAATALYALASAEQLAGSAEGVNGQRARASIIGASLLHMMHNRLGLYRDEEAFLAHAAAVALESF